MHLRKNLRTTDEKPEKLSNFQSKGGKCVHNPDKSLGKFELEMLDFKLQLKSDGATEVYLILRQCVLDDSRPGQDRSITR